MPRKRLLSKPLRLRAVKWVPGNHLRPSESSEARIWSGLLLRSLHYTHVFFGKTDEKTETGEGQEIRGRRTIYLQDTCGQCFHGSPWAFDLIIKTKRCTGIQDTQKWAPPSSFCCSPESSALDFQKEPSLWVAGTKEFMSIYQHTAAKSRGSGLLEVPHHLTSCWGGKVEWDTMRTAPKSSR